MKKIILSLLMVSALVPLTQANNIYKVTVLYPDRITDDWDNDGIPNGTDTDDDNDGIPDSNDDTPYGPTGGSSVTPPTGGGSYAGDDCSDGSLESTTVNTLNTWSGLSLTNSTWCTEPQIMVSGVVDIPDEIGALTNLTIFMIENSTINNIGNGFANLKSLQGFGLVGTNFSNGADMFEKLSKNTTLTMLSFESSDIGSTLTSHIGELTNLDLLSIRGSLLETVPPEIGLLTKLTTLQLINSKITSLPVGIGNLVNTPIIDFANNEIASLPNDIGNLSSVTMLRLHNNLLNSVPSTITNIPASTQHTLAYNPGYPFGGNACVIQGLDANHLNCTAPTAVTQGQQREAYNYFN